MSDAALRQRGEQGGRGVVPSTRARHRAYPPNRRTYRPRSAIERVFGRMKDRQRTAIRCDRLARNFLSIKLIARVSFWLA